MIKTADGGYIMERADKEKELKRYFEQLDYALDNVQIAMNVLREHYGVDFVEVGINGHSKHRVHLRCGIDEIGHVLGREVKLNTEWRAAKEFRWNWIEFVQLAEQNSMDFLPLNYRGKALFKLDD